MPRLAVLDVQQLSAPQRAIYDAIVTGPRGAVPGPLGIWLMSPELAQRAQELGAFCRYGTSLSPRLSELAILVTAAHWKAGYEWSVHSVEARKAGLDDAIILAIRAFGDPSFVHADERAVYNFARELLTDRSVSDATYAEAVAQLGEVGVIELTGILGYYGLISMTIRAFEIPMPRGEAEPFPQG